MKTVFSIMLCASLLLLPSTTSRGTPATVAQESAIGVGGGGLVGRYALIAASTPERDILLRLDTMTGTTLVAEGRKWVPFVEGLRANPKGVPGQLSLIVQSGSSEQGIYLLHTGTGQTWARDGSHWSPFQQDN